MTAPKPPRTLRRALRQLTNDAVNPGVYSGWVTPLERDTLIADGWGMSLLDRGMPKAWSSQTRLDWPRSFIVWTTPGRTLPPPHPQSLRSWVLSWWRMLL